LSWQFIYFTREIENLIDIDFDNPAFPDGIFENFDEKVESDGWELNLTAGLGETMSVSFDYTSTDAHFAGSSAQVQDIPESLVKLGWQYAGDRVPLELNVAVLSVGDVYDVVGGGVGRVDHGDYTVVDLGAAYYLDMDRRHRIGARLENALDEDYATSIGRGRLDLNNSSYAYRNLGAPRSAHVSYTYRF
jgi:vitamin B12 transporter